MQNYMTKSTYNRMIKQLEQIKNVEITKISKEKLEAARQGDLSENAEYEAAKENWNFCTFVSAICSQGSLILFLSTTLIFLALSSQ